MNIRNLGVLVAFAVCIAAPSWAGDSTEQVSAIIRNVGPYAEGVTLSMPRATVEQRLGAPYQFDRDANVALWRLEGRTLSIRFDRDSRVLSYSIHWIGRDRAIPAYSDLIPNGFIERSKRGTRIFESSSESAVIRWTRAPVPSGDAVVSILSISKPPLR